MADINSVVLQGRLTKNPDLKYLESGTARVFFTIAVNGYRGGKEKTDFISVTAYAGLAENIAKYLAKGSYISIAGRLESATYEKNGEKTYYVGVTVQSANFHPSTNKNGNGNGNTEDSGPKVNVDLGNEKNLADLMNETDDLLSDELEDAADRYFG